MRFVKKRPDSIQKHKVNRFVLLIKMTSNTKVTMCSISYYKFIPNTIHPHTTQPLVDRVFTDPWLVHDQPQFLKPQTITLSTI